MTTDAPCPTCGRMSLLRGRCVLRGCPSWEPQGTTTGLAEAPATEGLKTAQTALYGAHSDSDDPTDQETHR